MTGAQETSFENGKTVAKPATTVRPERPRTAAGSAPDRFAPLPREHGAWGLLLQPFVAAAVLARYWDWTLVVALALVVLGFILKDPLVVLARQRWVWRAPHPQTPIAARWLLYELLGIAACLALLLPWVPLWPFALLAIAALALTVAAVIFTVRNKQRSALLQLLSAAGLSTSSLLVALLATGGIPIWAWQLWAVLTLHAAASILTVHARLQMKISKKSSVPSKDMGSPRRSAALAHGGQVAVAIFLAASGNALLAIPLLFSAACGAVELYRLRLPATLAEPLKRVGFRALAVSIVHAALLIGVLSNAAAPGAESLANRDYRHRIPRCVAVTLPSDFPLIGKAITRT